MSTANLETAADPEALTERLPAAPGEWTRTDESGGVIEYRLPSDESPCTAAKVAVRPDVLGDAAVRLVRKRGCSSAGDDRYDSVDAAVRAVTRELRHVLTEVEGETPSSEL